MSKKKSRAKVKNYSWFTTFSFLIRGLEALGASAYSTASYVIIVNVFPDNAGAVRIGGYGLPFYVIGLVIILIAPLNVYLLPSSEKHAMETKSGSFTKLMKLTPVVVTCFIIVVIAMTWSFLDPTLEPHLRKFKLSPGNIGLIFLLLSAMYGIFSPAWGWVTDRMNNYWWLMTLGLFCNSASLLLLGPSSILFFLEDSILLNIIALSTLGISVAMSLMPTYQAILDSALDGGFVDNLGTHSVIAGLWSSVYSLGEVLGPILGGTLLEHYGFSLTSTVFCCLNLTMAFLGTLYFFSRDKADNTCKLYDSQVGYQLYKPKNSEIITGPRIEKGENGKWTAKLK
ncbi:MFS-type transporter SLC18B1-like [Asbolus verrucosus]|uniref:MFS-type transporter SLC18B1-like n=1 Tax=Asbolus verrucosus TaxID=1661398 RepID=A0A482W9G2_ASBVE|nr:MFS-type transporter SLC18B1-like [Asbolus verrucosus]